MHLICIPSCLCVKRGVFVEAVLLVRLSFRVQGSEPVGRSSSTARPPLCLSCKDETQFCPHVPHPHVEREVSGWVWVGDSYCAAGDAAVRRRTVPVRHAAARAGAGVLRARQRARQLLPQVLGGPCALPRRQRPGAVQPAGRQRHAQAGGAQLLAASVCASRDALWRVVLMHHTCMWPRTQKVGHTLPAGSDI
jgi:hypothetical protein